jgi:hypothetical protein
MDTQLFMEQEPLYKQGWNDDHKLLLKLSQILGEVGAIPKTGVNKFHGYKYHSEGDVNSAFQKLFHTHKIMFSASMVSSEMRETTTLKGNTEFIYKANMRFTFFDAETGESLTGCMSGEGQDNGDKALYKSISGTQKYILMKTFMITDHMDPEGDPTVDERNHKDPSRPAEAPNGQPTPTHTHSPSQPSTSPAAASSGGLASEGQTKMLYAKSKGTGWSDFAQVNEFLGYTITKFAEVKAADVTKLAQFLDRNKAA